MTGFVSVRPPATVGRDEEQQRCCTRCRRGMPGMLGPCGYNGACKCHGGAS